MSETNEEAEKAGRVDITGREIKVGDYVRYKGTGSSFGSGVRRVVELAGRNAIVEGLCSLISAAFLCSFLEVIDAPTAAEIETTAKMDTYLSARDLKDRRWTRALIRRFLWGSGPFALETIERVESSPEFLEAKKKGSCRGRRRGTALNIMSIAGPMDDDSGSLRKTDTSNVVKLADHRGGDDV
jgi:hypothetical protein